ASSGAATTPLEITSSCSPWVGPQVGAPASSTWVPSCVASCHASGSADWKVDATSGIASSGAAGQPRPRAWNGSGASLGASQGVTRAGASQASSAPVLEPSPSVVEPSPSVPGPAVVSTPAVV